MEAFGRAADNPVGGFYGLRSGYRGRFGMYLPPLLEELGLAELHPRCPQQPDAGASDKRKVRTMSTPTVVRYTTTPEAAEENERLIRGVFEQLAEHSPAGLRYLAIRLDDGVSFAHVALVEGEDNPLVATPAFGAFVSGMGDRTVDGPIAVTGTVIGDFGTSS